MKAKDLKGTSFGHPLIFISSDDLLECWECLQSIRGGNYKYALLFNGAYNYFKSFGGLKYAAEKLIKEYNLIQQ